MIRIYPEQLRTQLNEKLCTCYLLYGNDPLLLQESQDLIRQIAKLHHYDEYHHVAIDAHTDWNTVFEFCQLLSLFTQRQILKLDLPENGLTAAISDQLTQLTTLLHQDLLLILSIPRLTKAQENSAWYQALNPHSVYVNCQSPDQSQLPRWVAARAKAMKLTLDDKANQLLCYYYEGNLLALAQTLDLLSLLYPDGKLTLPRVEEAVYDAAHFSPYHWIDALLAGKANRACHILQQLAQEGMEATILLRTLQRELLLLLTLHHQSNTLPQRTLFDKHKIWQNRRALFSQALHRLSTKQLHQATSLLCAIEISLKQDYSQSVWLELESLTMLLCAKPLATSW